MSYCGDKGGIYYNPYTNEIVSKDCTKKEFDNIKQSCGSQLVYFPTAFEFCVFDCVSNILPLEKIKIHPQIELKPPTKNWKASKWTLDLKLTMGLDSVTTKGMKMIFYYIECKNFISREFLLKLQLLDCYYPHIHSKLIVCYDHLNEHWEKEKIKLFKVCPALNLMSLKELEKWLIKMS